MPKLKRMAVGDQLSAAWANSLIDAIEDLQEEVTRLRTRKDDDVEFDRPLRARISARSGVGSDGTGLEPGVKYSVTIKDLGITVDDVVPTYGRPLRAAGSMVPRIKAANIDDFCMVVRRKNADGSAAESEYWIHEEIAGAVCATGPGGEPARLLKMQQQRAIATSAGAPASSSAGGGTIGA